MSDAVWVWSGVDADAAKPRGRPAASPLPRADFERRAAGGSSIENARRWTGSFLGELGDRACQPALAKLEDHLELALRDLCADASTAGVAQTPGLGELAKRHRAMRWAEAEALSATGERAEARAAFMARARQTRRAAHGQSSRAG